MTQTLAALFFAAVMIDLVCWVGIFLLVAPIRRRRLQRQWAERASWPPPEVP